MATSTTLALAVRPSSAATSGTETGVIIPLYNRPDSTWNTVIQARSTYPNVPIAVIVNPNNGPGASSDPAFLTGIRNLQAAGVTVLGYVDMLTGGGTLPPRTVAAAENQIDEYHNWYATNGIFFDDFNNGFTYSPATYATLDSYVKAQGMPQTMGNPGSVVPTSYHGVFDSLVISENSNYPSISTLSSATSGYPKSDFAYLAYGVSLNTAFEISSAQYVGWLYITNLSGNPWASLASYYTNEVAALSTVNPSTTSTTTTTSTISTTSTITSTSTSSTTATSSAASGPLTVRSEDLTGAALSGIQATISSALGGVTVASGPTPLVYTATFGVQYTVCVGASYQSDLFQHWADGTTTNCKNSTPNQANTMTAFYSTATVLALTVLAADVSGNPITGMWVMIQSGGVNLTQGYTPFTYAATSGTPYVVLTDGYQTVTFGHWDDGTMNKARAFTPTQNSVLTAFFGSSASTTTTSTATTTTTSTSTSTTSSTTPTTTSTTTSRTTSSTSTASTSTSTTRTTTTTSPTTTTTTTAPATSTVITTAVTTTVTSIATSATITTTTVTTSVTATPASTSTTQTSTAQPFGFSFILKPSTNMLAQGASGNATVSVSLTGGTPAPLALSATGAPQGLSVSFSPASGQAAFVSTMHVVVSTSLSPGTYKLMVVAQANQITQSQEFDVIVTAFQLAKYSLTTISPSGSGTVTPTPSTYTHSANDLVAVSAAPGSGWHLDHWLVNGVTAGNGLSLSLIMTGNVQVQPVFSSSTQGGATSPGTNASAVAVSILYTTSGGTPVTPTSAVIYGPKGFETLGSANSTLRLDTNTRYTLVSAQVMGVNTVPLNQASSSFVVTKPQSLTFALSVYPVQLKLVDLFGQPIQGAQVQLTTEGGQVLQAVTDGAGVASFAAVPSGWFDATYSYLGVSGHVQDSTSGPHIETVTLALSYPLISVGAVIAGAVALTGVRAWRRQRAIANAFG